MSRPREKVIFDTNALRNIEVQFFLGGREMLKRFATVAEIVLPEIVVDELKHQKRTTLFNEKQAFLGNVFSRLTLQNREEIESFDIEAHLVELEQKEDLAFKVIELSDHSVLARMKELAIARCAPFEEGGTDKGFKDAYIYFTILEYLQKIPDDHIFVCTKDKRLQKAFETQTRIKVIEDFEGFKRNTIISLVSDYFAEKLSTALGVEVKPEDVQDWWINISGNRVLLVKNEATLSVVEVEEGEILNWVDPTEYEEMVGSLTRSGSFASTHAAISQLDNYKMFLSDQEIIQILERAVANPQIYRILIDDDVRQFISELFEAKSELLDLEARKDLESRVNGMPGRFL